MKKYILALIVIPYLSLSAMEQKVVPAARNVPLFPKIVSLPSENTPLTLVDAEENEHFITLAAAEQTQLLPTLNSAESIPLPIQPAAMNRLTQYLESYAEDSWQGYYRILQRKLSLSDLCEDAYAAHFVGAETILNDIINKIASHLIRNNDLDEMVSQISVIKSNYIASALIDQVQTLLQNTTAEKIEKQLQEFVYRNVRAYSPDWAQVAVASSSNILSISETATDKFLRKIHFNNKILSTKFSHDGNRIAVATSDILFIYNINTQRLSHCDLPQLFYNKTQSIAWSPDDTIVAVGSHWNISLLHLNAETFTPVDMRIINIDSLGNEIIHLMFLPNKPLLAIFLANHELGILNIETQKFRHISSMLSHRLLSYETMAWSPDNKRLIIEEVIARCLSIWDIQQIWEEEKVEAFLHKIKARQKQEVPVAIIAETQQLITPVPRYQEAACCLVM